MELGRTAVVVVGPIVAVVEQVVGTPACTGYVAAFVAAVAVASTEAVLGCSEPLVDRTAAVELPGRIG